MEVNQYFKIKFLMIDIVLKIILYIIYLKIYKFIDNLIIEGYINYFMFMFCGFCLMIFE